MTTTSAYVSTVDANRMIELPPNVPIGAKVAIIVLPSEEVEEESVTRAMRFQKVMDAIRAAINSNFESPEVSDRELNDLFMKLVKQQSIIDAYYARHKSVPASNDASA